MWYRIILNKVGSCAQKCHWYVKTVIDGCIPTYISSYLDIYMWPTKNARVCQQCDGLFYTTVFPLLLNQYISNISNLYNLDENLSLASQTIYDHNFSDPKLDHTFHIFGYVPGLYIFPSHMQQLSTYFEDGNLLESTVSWFLINRIDPS